MQWHDFVFHYISSVWAPSGWTTCQNVMFNYCTSTTFISSDLQVTAENDTALLWVCGLIEIVPLCPGNQLFASKDPLNNCTVFVAVRQLQFIMTLFYFESIPTPLSLQTSKGKQAYNSL